MKPAIADLPRPTRSVSVRRSFDLNALAALAVLTLRQNLRGRRLLILSLLFALPSILAVITRLADSPPPPEMLEFVFIFFLIPHALITLTTLLYAAGSIQDEVEEQTLTYLLTRPLPRWALYVTKLGVTWLVTTLLTAFFTTLTYAVIYWNTPELWGEVLPVRAAKMAALMALMQASYCSGFGVLGLATRRSLIAGIVYSVAFEGLLANFELVVRRLTVMYYFRVLTVRWLKPPGSEKWSLDLTLAPGSGECVLTLLGVSAVLLLLGAVMMSGREFRMKTPEGS